MIDTQPTMESVPDLKDFLSTLYGEALTDDQILSMLIGRFVFTFSIETKLSFVIQHPITPNRQLRDNSRCHHQWRWNRHRIGDWQRNWTGCINWSGARPCSKCWNEFNRKPEKDRSSACWGTTVMTTHIYPNIYYTIIKGTPNPQRAAKCLARWWCHYNWCRAQFIDSNDKVIFDKV